MNGSQLFLFVSQRCSEHGVGSECYGMWAEGGKGKSTIVSLVYIHYLSTKELLMLYYIILSHLSYMVYRKQFWHFSLSLLDGSSLAGVCTSTDSIKMLDYWQHPFKVINFNLSA